MIHYVYGAFIALLLPDTQSRFVGPFANIIYFLIFDFPTVSWRGVYLLGATSPHLLCCSSIPRLFLG